MQITTTKMDVKN